MFVVAPIEAVHSRQQAESCQFPAITQGGGIMNPPFKTNRVVVLKYCFALYFSQYSSSTCELLSMVLRPV